MNGKGDRGEADANIGQIEDGEVLKMNIINNSAIDKAIYEVIYSIYYDNCQ